MALNQNANKLINLFAIQTGSLLLDNILKINIAAVKQGLLKEYKS